MVAAVMMAGGTIVLEFRVFPEFRAPAKVNLARAAFAWWFCPAGLCPASRTTFYFHNGKNSSSLINFSLFSCQS
jgi:hypothetical protein